MDQAQKTHQQRLPQPPTKVNQSRAQRQKVFYDCQCGKRYDAFPGLYLHFKRRHDIKISSHPSPNTYNVWQTPFTKVFTYLFTDKSNGSQNKKMKVDESFYPKFKLIIEEYYKAQKLQKSQINSSLMALDKFSLYLSSKIKQSSDLMEGEFLENLPHKFNDFFLNEIQSGGVTVENFSDWSDIFLQFSRWLNKRGYSDLITVKNQGFCLEEK